MEEEIWVPAITWMNGKKYDFTGYYEVSNLGRICGIERHDKLGRLRKRALRKPQFGKSNYYIMALSKEGFMKTIAVAKLVYESFNGPVPEGMQVNHINELRTDNRLENLNILTPKENTNWGGHNERVRKAQLNRKDLSIEVFQYDLEGNLLKVWPSAKEIERCLGFKNQNISNCCNKTKYHTKQYAYGFIWKRRESI